MLSLDQLQHVANTLDNLPLDEQAIAQLRVQYPGIHFTYCMDDDIPNHEPVMHGNGFNLYLVDGREHCLCLTRDFAQATGIVVAEVIEDQD